ncbi:MAG TPA: hypothetical protein VII72_07215 [Myxococcota bacterium]|jgi:hypothetical protein
MRSAAPQAAPLATWRWGLAFLLPASVLLVLLVASQRADPDLWGRISIGAVLFEAGHLPRSDDFSYTANGARWIDHEWLSGVVFYALLRASGEPALMFFKYAAAACALALVLAAHRSAYRVSPLWGAGALALLAPLYLAGYLSTIRAQAFSIGFFLLWLAALERVRLGDWRAARLAWLVPLAVLWGNLHGGFVMGVLAVALYAVAYALLRRRADALRHAGLAAALVAAVALVNPYGPVYLGFLLHAWSLDRTGISEWQPLLAGPWSPGNLTLAAVAALGAGLALRALVHGWRSGEIRLRAAGQPRATDARPPVGPALVLLLVVGMTLLARRIHPFMALTLALYLPLLASPSGGRPSRPGRAALVAGVAVPIAGCLAALFLLALRLPERPVLRSFVPDERSRVEPRYRYPVGAVRFLREAPYGGRLLNPFTPGEFLYWSLYPKWRVAIDGRYEEVYTREQFLWVTRFYAEPDPHRIAQLARSSAADAVLLRAGTPAFAALSASRDWSVPYDDGFWALALLRSRVDRHPPFRFEAAPRARPPRIADFFTASDRKRFAAYPRGPN